MSTQRHDVNCSEAQIGGHAYFGHSDQMCFDDGVMHLATRQNLGERVAHELSYTQLTLRRTGLAMMSACHAMLVLNFLPCMNRPETDGAARAADLKVLASAAARAVTDFKSKSGTSVGSESVSAAEPRTHNVR